MTGARRGTPGGRPASSAERELQDLLAPHAVETFLDEHWGERALHIPGPALKFAPLGLDIPAFERIVRGPRGRGRFEVRFVGPGNKVGPAPVPRASYSVSDRGLTACADWISDAHPPLAAYCARIRAALSQPGSVFMTGYASPRDHGLGTHFDCHPNFVLQLAGSKRWRYSERPAVAWPPANLPNAEVGREMLDRYAWIDVGFPDEAEEQGFCEATLTPGDVLYLPAGTWHRTEAEDDSLALTMTVVPRTAADFVDDLVRGHLSSSPEWRRSVPPVASRSGASDRLPPTVEDFFHARLRELRSYVTSLRPQDLHRIWVERVHESDVAVDSGAGDPSRPEVRQEHLLQLADGGPLDIVASPGGGIISLYYLDRRVEAAEAARPLVDAVAAGAPFVAGEAESLLGPPYAWRDVKPLLQKLVDAGVLRVDDEGTRSSPRARAPRKAGPA